jgi:predicted metalloprotease with PDZ domain
VKLYRPDENSKNSSVSYYLKGGLVFTVLHALLVERGRSVDDLLTLLWSDFKANPRRGVTRDDVYRMVRELGGDEVLARFSTMVETTVDVDFEGAFRTLGCELRWSEPAAPWIGADFEYTGDRVFVKAVTLDSPAQKGGLNAGDELLFLNGLRFEKGDAEKLCTLVLADRAYEFVLSRLGKLERVEVIPGRAPRQLKEIAVVDRARAERAFSFGARPGRPQTA